MKKYDVIIIGAGPAGLKCAEILSKNKKKVLVLEKNKDIGEKVCAGGLSIKAFNLGIPENLIEKKFKSIIVHTPLQEKEVKLKKPFIATLKREDLGKWMANKALEAGVKIRKCAEVNQIKNNFVIVNGKEKIAFEFLIGADGGNSIVRKHLNIKTEKFLQTFQYILPKKSKDLEFFLNPKKFAHYLWVFPHKDFTSIGTGCDIRKDSKKKALGFTISELKNNFDKFCAEKFSMKQNRFEAGIINYDYKGYHFGNKFLIGDAGGFASGLTGEGIYFAIKSGEDVAKKIINKNYSCPNIKHIIKLKKIEEKLLKSIEYNRTLTLIEFELLNSLINLSFIKKLLLKL